MNYSENTSDREVITTRVMNASQQNVWKAWTNPDHVKNWWGPDGFTNTIHTYDFTPGGKWIFTMHGPDGNNYENTCVFVSMEPAYRLVFDHLLPVHEFRVTATFEKITEQQTRVTFHMIFKTREEWQRVQNYVPQANEQNFDRLEEELKRM